MSHHQEYPFKSSALAKQAVLEADPKAYPLREKAPSIIITPAKPRLIEDKEDAFELVLTVALLGAIVIGFILTVELMYPGWSLSILEVTNG